MAAQNTESVVKVIMDVAAVGITAASIIKWLPPIAAAFSIVWLTLQIGEKIYNWFGK